MSAEWSSQPTNEPLLHSASYDLYGIGGCGSASIVFSRLLDEIRVPARIAQMRCGDSWGCHIIVEARVGDRWVAVDPWFNLVYQRADGSLASAADLRREWPSFAAIIPANYPREYRYEAVRYTNWGKVPGIGPALVSAARKAGWAGVDSVSIRSVLLRGDEVRAWLIAALWAALAVVTLWRSRRDRTVWFRPYAPARDAAAESVSS